MKNKPGILSNLFGIACLILNLLAIVWLALCYVASFLRPESIKDIAVLSLTTPFAIIVNAAFVIFWLITRWRVRAVFSLLTLLACYKIVLEIFAFNFVGQNDFPRGENTLKLMSWNVHGLGIFDKPHNKNATGIMDCIKQEDPDVLCMPEYYVYASDTLKPFTAQILSQNHFSSFHFHIDNNVGDSTLLGVAIFSKYPVLDYKNYNLGKAFISLSQCDIQVSKNRIIRMFFVHLYSFSLSGGDRAYLSFLRAKGIPEESDIAHSRSFIWRFNQVYKIRAREADIIAAEIHKSPYPVLICGDFNDLPASYTYTTVRDGLNDAFIDKGVGLGRTYNQIEPTLRIDHIFYDPSALQITGYKCLPLRYSDHNPIIAGFIVK